MSVPDAGLRDAARPRPWPRRGRRAISLTGTLICWAALGAALALAVVTAGSAVTGHRAFNVLSGSMRPTLDVGSVVLAEPISPTDARPGDIITFPDPGRPDRLVTHRLKSMGVRGDRAYIVTKGDANSVPERWNVSVADELGRVVVHLPKVGYARVWIAGRNGRLLAVLLVLLWGIMAVREIWRRPDEADDAARPSRPIGSPQLQPVPRP